MLRTHTCGELRPGHVGTQATLTGWVDSVRDHGGVTFLDLRDRYGRTQIMLDPDQVRQGADLVAELRNEKCVLIRGVVQERPTGMTNPKIPTGAIEVAGHEIEILGPCPPLPFSISDATAEAGDDVRFRYRFLDLRREKVRDRFVFRSTLLHEIRSFLHAEHFVDIETPVLTKSTPEGARDFLVPSRLHPGTFYALPQSPQIFKQLCMVAGLDRYMQVVKCFRDEDLRADRQPEFTQLDLEMSFVTEDDVIDLIERMMKHVLKRTLGIVLDEAFPRLTYADAMRRFGTDAPDLRYGLELVDITDIASGMDFRVFKEAADAGGAVRGIHVEHGDVISRKDITELETHLKDFGAAGLAWARWTPDGWSGPVSKFLVGEAATSIVQRFGAKVGSLLLFVADKQLKTTHVALNELRKRLAQRCGLIQPGVLKLLWVVDFPLLEFDAEGGRYVACHHPFTSPKPEDAHRLETDPGAIRARAYDLVLNGIEVGGGSIRIHERELQQRLFAAIGIGPAEAESKFEFLLEGLKYGAPPHGGIALGVDRLVMLLLGLDSIREVIAFPKSQRGTCFLTAAPTPVDDSQLRDLHVQTRPVAKPAGS